MPWYARAGVTKCNETASAYEKYTKEQMGFFENGYNASVLGSVYSILTESLNALDQ